MAVAGLGLGQAEKVRDPIAPKKAAKSVIFQDLQKISSSSSTEEGEEKTTDADGAGFRERSEVQAASSDEGGEVKLEDATGSGVGRAPRSGAFEKPCYDPRRQVDEVKGGFSTPKSQKFSKPQGAAHFDGTIVEKKVGEKLKEQPTPFKCHVTSYLWADYFNIMKKCWEPLLERCMVTLLHEQVA